MALRYADVPVVVAPAGLALGGGCEIVLHGDRVQAAAESYIGLVEVGVGLIPGRRRHEGDAGARRRRHAAGAAPICCRSSSACSRRSASRRSRPARPTRRQLGYLRRRRRDHDEPRAADGRREGAARSSASRDGYQPPAPRTAIPVGGDGVLAALKLGVHLAWRAGRISDHDAVDRPRRWRRSSPAATLPHADDGQRSSTCSTSSARRS